METELFAERKRMVQEQLTAPGRDIQNRRVAKSDSESTDRAHPLVPAARKYRSRSNRLSARSQIRCLVKETSAFYCLEHYLSLGVASGNGVPSAVARGFW